VVPGLDQGAPTSETVERYVVIGDGDAGSLPDPLRYEELLAAQEPGYAYAELDERQARHILGPQANLWTERRPDDAACDDYIWPRLCAMAEVAWSAKPRRYYPAQYSTTG
jgi:N-acetyl-beta-hexosaminidase